MAIKEKGRVSSINEMVKKLKEDREFMDGVLRGVDDCKSGKVRRWSEIKEELGI